MLSERSDMASDVLNLLERGEMETRQDDGRMAMMRVEMESRMLRLRR